MAGTADDPVYLSDTSDDADVPVFGPRTCAPKRRSDGSAAGSAAGSAKKPRFANGAHVSVDALIAFIKEGQQTNLLFTFGPLGAAGVRNVVGEGWAYATVPLPTALPMPQRATQSHVAAGAKPGFGENSGMIDDFNGARRATGVLLADGEVSRLLTAAYGADFCLADDRAHYRDKKLAVDACGAGRTKLLATGHTDFPKWARQNISAVPVQTARWNDGELCIIALHQCKKHGIPQGGHTLRDPKEAVVGWFVSPLQKPTYAKYCAATVARLTKEANKQARPYAWPELHKLLALPPDRVPQYLFAAAIAFGLRPILYPSQKVINVPQSSCPAVYKHFDTYFPAPTTLTVDPAGELAALSPAFREYFATVHATLGPLKFACRVSTLSPEYLRRTLGLV